MTDKIVKTQASKAPSRAAEVREARLKAALKANMARRKAQAKQRGETNILPQTAFDAESDDSSGTERE